MFRKIRAWDPVWMGSISTMISSDEWMHEWVNSSSSRKQIDASVNSCIVLLVLVVLELLVANSDQSDELINQWVNSSCNKEMNEWMSK